jgi:isopentenyl-diphosphate delta-isomerase
MPPDAAPPARPAPADELVDVLDATGAVVGTATRAEVRARNLRHRSVGIVVLDGRGRLLAHRRAADKDIWPGWWDLACGGVVGAGEAWDDAARRELLEELGIDGHPQLLGEGAWADDDTDAVVRVYAVEHDGPYRFDDGEVVEARWVGRAELDALRASAPFCPDSVAVGLPLVAHRLR